jgi:hypothetical protein
MTRFLLIAAFALLVVSGARAQTRDISDVTLSGHSGELQSFADSLVFGDSREFSLGREGAPARIDTQTLAVNDGDLQTHDPPVVHSAPEFHAAGAIAALTLLLCGVAVLKGWRRE